MVQICKEVLVLREQYKDNIYAAANQAVSDGTPINRPIWWVDPTDPETFMIDNRKLILLNGLKFCTGTGTETINR